MHNIVEKIILFCLYAIFAAFIIGGFIGLFNVYNQFGSGSMAKIAPSIFVIIIGISGCATVYTESKQR